MSHIPQASASAPNLLSFPFPTHHTAPPVCADRCGEIQTEEAVVSASRHHERTIIQSASMFRDCTVTIIINIGLNIFLSFSVWSYLCLEGGNRSSIVCLSSSWPPLPP